MPTHAPSSSPLEQALVLHQHGRLPEAEALYRQVLQTQPQHFDALYLLGLVLLDKHQPQAAGDLITRALTINPHHADAHYHLGLTRAANQQKASALACYETAIRLNHKHVDAHYDRANTLRELGRLEEAVVAYIQVWVLNPNHFQALHNRAVALQQLQRHTAALESFEQALRINPKGAEIYVGRGGVLRALGQLEAAIQSCDQALSLNPALAAAYFERGLALFELHRLEEARDSFEQALQLNPNYAQAFNSLGNTLMNLHQFESALTCYEQAIGLDENYAETYVNRGVVLHGIGHLDAALTSYQQALQRQPDLADAHWNKSRALLASGRFEEGWKLYEWRRQVGQFKKIPSPFKQAPWLGEEELMDKSLLLYAEQGFGDTLQFCRYVPLAKKRGAKKICLAVGQPLIRLLSSLSGVDLLSADEVPLCDFHCPLPSLPLAFKTFREHDIPGNVPYLAADPILIQSWKTRLPPRIKPRVGLVWSGGFRPDSPHVLAIHARRNLPFELLARLNNADFDFFSLQKGEPAESALPAQLERYWQTSNFHVLTEHIQDFADTAALIMNLDLVIGVDTAVVHLAGALGKPVWMLNRFDSCWRWLNNRQNSPWYPTLRIFQQPSAGDWSSVIEQVQKALLIYREQAL